MLLGSFSMEAVEVFIMVVGAAKVAGAGVDVDAEADILELGPITRYEYNWDGYEFYNMHKDRSVSKQSQYTRTLARHKNYNIFTCE
jgi:hypothetical protein